MNQEHQSRQPGAEKRLPIFDDEQPLLIFRSVSFLGANLYGLGSVGFYDADCGWTFYAQNE